jgi:hypothetical protein
MHSNQPDQVRRILSRDAETESPPPPPPPPSLPVKPRDILNLMKRNEKRGVSRDAARTGGHEPDCLN